MIVGGGAILPGVVDIAQEVFGTKVKLFVPHQVGIRNPMFANVIGLVEYVGTLTEVDIIAQSAVTGEELLRRKPIDIDERYTMSQTQSTSQTVPVYEENHFDEEVNFQEAPKAHEPKQNFGDKVRGLFGSMFD